MNYTDAPDRRLAIYWRLQRQACRKTRKVQPCIVLQTPNSDDDIGQRENTQG